MLRRVQQRCHCLQRQDQQRRTLRGYSMFEWYRRAAVCYAYLVDVPDAGANHWRISSAFLRSGRDVNHARKLFTSIATQLASRSLSEAIAKHRGITSQTLGD